MKQEIINTIYEILDNYAQRIKTSRDVQLTGKAKLRLPNLSADPAQGEVGELVVVGGKLKVCTVASLTAATWTIVGTQS